MAYFFIKAGHIFFLAILVMSLAGLWALYLKGNTERSHLRKFYLMIHGVGLMGLLISGFAILGIFKLKMGAWVWIKIGLWTALGVVPIFYKKWCHKQGLLSYMLWWLPALLIGIIAFVAVYKP